MFIDIHTHTCRAKGVGDAVGQSFNDPEGLIALLDGYGIDRAVLLPIVSPENQTHYITTEETLEIAAAHPERFIPFCCLDSRMRANGPGGDFSKVLAYYKEAGCRGVGEYITNLPFDAPVQMNLFRQVEAAGLPLTFHVGPTLGEVYGCYDELGLPRLEKVLRACPNLTFLAHSTAFWSEISADVTDETRQTYPKGKVTPGRVVDLMRSYPGLWGDLSAGSGFTAISRDPEFGYGFMEEFQDRLLFGTDICWPGQKAPIVAYFHKLRDEGLISKAAYEKITWQNADRLLGLGIGG